MSTVERQRAERREQRLARFFAAFRGRPDNPDRQYLLDTPALMQVHRHPGVSRGRDAGYFLSALSFQALRRRALQLRAEWREDRATRVEIWMERLRQQHGHRILPIDLDTALLAGELQHRGLRAEAARFAASALLNGLTLLTPDPDRYREGAGCGERLRLSVLTPPCCASDVSAAARWRQE